MHKNNFFYEEKKELISINITPLIDIVFLLLVFFMLATSFMQKSSMEVNLASNEAEISEKKDFITIVLKKDGNLLIKSKLFTISNINKEIKKNLKIN